jgi:hypothetical protein
MTNDSITADRQPCYVLGIVYVPIFGLTTSGSPRAHELTAAAAAERAPG